jgi:hypothetical protein
MEKDHRPPEERSEPPVFVRGALADHLMNMLLDQQRCQSCTRLIDVAERWGVVATVRRDDPEATACIQAVRLCHSCWGYPASAMRKLGFWSQ